MQYMSSLTRSKIHAELFMIREMINSQHQEILNTKNAILKERQEMLDLYVNLNYPPECFLTITNIIENVSGISYNNLIVPKLRTLQEYLAQEKDVINKFKLI
jgi:hypothetical protein